MSCKSGCASGCTGSCKDKCGTDCTGYCGTKCEGTAKSGDGCVGCSSGCANQCGGKCLGGCKQECTTDCGGSCSGTCSKKCKENCSGCDGCSGSCSGCDTQCDTCTAACKNDCQAECTTGCLGCSGCTSCTSCSGCTSCTGCTSCSGQCSQECGTGCEGQSAASSWNEIDKIARDWDSNVRQIIFASDLSELEKVVRNEVSRRNLVPQSNNGESKDTITKESSANAVLNDLLSLKNYSRDPSTAIVTSSDKVNPVIQKSTIRKYIDVVKALYKVVIPGSGSSSKEISGPCILYQNGTWLAGYSKDDLGISSSNFDSTPTITENAGKLLISIPSSTYNNNASATISLLIPKTAGINWSNINRVCITFSNKYIRNTTMYCNAYTSGSLKEINRIQSSATTRFKNGQTFTYKGVTSTDSGAYSTTSISGLGYAIIGLVSIWPDYSTDKEIKLSAMDPVEITKIWFE